MKMWKIALVSLYLVSQISFGAAAEGTPPVVPSGHETQDSMAQPTGPSLVVEPTEPVHGTGETEKRPEKGARREAVVAKKSKAEKLEELINACAPSQGSAHEAKSFLDEK